MADTLQWIQTRLHPVYLRRIKVSRCDTYVSGAVYGRYALAAKPVGSPESAVTYIGRVSKWRLKGTCKLFTGFLVCVKISHNLDYLDVL